ncbi:MULTISPECIES: lipopolysaccharide biosynthesis protein [unclassified Francisella]|uniref:lipopolysaccharide biosynthesis protein n=1 Tax=unclassified Francisella TaxID=2610885 RepID=UPI002E331692|nr:MULTISPECIES: oligosaccharide flippase family protein [unclassified Francisella]MED7818613.1 oligosaccharide flippase family protein [Francisella sp. 19S2-4]MED7829449.1 oligosaccharide flippase family protein [Francisella sp. 19S2-10]
MIKKFLTYGIGSIGSAAISFFTVPFITRVLSPDNYGKGTLYITIITLLFYISNAGLDMGYMRFFYEKKTREEQVRLFYQCLIIVLSLAFFISVNFFFFRCNILDFFFQSNSFVLYLSIICGLTLYILNRFIMLSIRMQQKAFLYSLAQILNSIGYLIGLFVFYYIFKIFSFKLIIYSQLISLSAVSLFLILLDLDRWKVVKYFDSSVFYKGSLKEIFKYSWPFIFSFITIWGMQYIDRLFLIKYGSFYELGIYSASFTLIAPLVVLQSTFGTMWVPIGNKLLLHTSKKAKVIYSFLYQNLMSLFFVGMLFVFLFREPLSWILGEKFREAINIFMWLLFIPFFNLLGQLLNAGIIKTKKTMWNIWASILGFLANIISCFIFIPMLGAEGAALSLVIGSLVFFLVKMYSNQYLFPYRLNNKFSILNIVLFCILFVISREENLGVIIYFICFLIFLLQLTFLFKKKNIQSFKLLKKTLNKI